MKYIYTISWTLLFAHGPPHQGASPSQPINVTIQCMFLGGPNKSMSHDITTFSTCSRIMALARCTSAASPNCTCSQVFQPPKHRKKRPTCSSVPLIRNLSQEPLIFWDAAWLRVTLPLFPTLHGYWCCGGNEHLLWKNLWPWRNIPQVSASSHSFFWRFSEFCFECIWCTYIYIYIIQN